MKPIRVYVAGPISHGNQFMNCIYGIQVADELLALGFFPFCPHLSLFWHMVSGRSARLEEWLRYDFEWLGLCDALLRMPGKSIGADMEVEFAVQHDIPVFHSIEQIRRWADAVHRTE